ncbi:MAG TPA: J domain-containing protein [Polyangiaceae bacterium]|nr:J domain-containing protein [Polyangiaceae bacterium]
MNPEQALVALSLTRPTSKDAVRRAYLRGVRAHPPERDPHGFQQVRAAYELLKDAPWLWGSEETSREEPNPDAIASLQADGDVDATAVPAGDTPLGVPFGSTLKSSEKGVAGAIAQALEPAPTPSVQIAKAAPVAADATNEASPAGESWRSLRAPVDSPSARFKVRYWQQRFGEPPDEGQAALVAWQALDTALDLFKNGEGSVAKPLLEGLSNWATRFGVRSAELGPALNARWVLLRELAALDSKVQPELVRVLAKSIGAGKLEQASKAIDDAYAADVSFERRFPQLAPSLHRAVSPFVRRRSKKAEGPLKLVFSVIWALVMLARFIPDGAPVRENAVVPRSTPTRTFTRAPPSPAAMERAREEQLAASAADMDLILEAGSCAQVLVQWQVYAAAVRVAPRHDQAAEDMLARVEPILQKCKEIRREDLKSP